MGDHYIPQYYLRGFCPGFGRALWVFDKQEERAFQTDVKDIANICGFSPQNLEKCFSEDTQHPANKVIDKIRNRERLTSDDKISLSNYITVLWNRVPEERKRLDQRAPDEIALFREQMVRELDKIASKDPSKGKLVQRKKLEVYEIFDRLSAESADDFWHDVIPVDQSPRMVPALATMTWRFLTLDDKHAFLTGDNPVFIFPDIGIGRPESELSIPITGNIALWATRRIDLEDGYFPGTMSKVKEINRRTASNAARFVFYGEDEDWIPVFLARKRWKLNHMS